MNTKVIFLSSVFLLPACSATDTGMRFVNESPRGLSIINVTKEDKVKAYRNAEKHCAKYYKVPRILKTIHQDSGEDSAIPMRTIKYECIKPSN